MIPKVLQDIVWKFSLFGVNRRASAAAAVVIAALVEDQTFTANQPVSYTAD